jgi:hypothetical protein
MRHVGRWGRGDCLRTSKRLVSCSLSWLRSCASVGALATRRPRADCGRRLWVVAVVPAAAAPRLRAEAGRGPVPATSALQGEPRGMPPAASVMAPAEAISCLSQPSRLPLHAPVSGHQKYQRARGLDQRASQPTGGRGLGGRGGGRGKRRRVPLG